ncbi:ER membrane protein complex subunit 9 [Bagarius yarrelli]|uniref:ER membrane protein complex subunit 9 n=1 Tax=Bagarius yarrelli TaxID=175774 RepID=A0A556VVS3_BAGYA|nr:ER membrane protein complex subunit 9 [Bagarius yarrelli]
MSEVELSCLACVKMFLHASVYPRCSVNGLLLAPAAGGGGGRVCEEGVCVTDCVPLLHSHLPLAMTAQLALTQVDVWCSQTQQRIVGYYQANAHLSDSRIMLRQWEETRAVTAQLLNSTDHTLLVDFDSHLDDITKDWTNQKLNARIMELVCPANGNM